MNATISIARLLAHSWAHAARRMAPKPAHRRRVQILCAALAVLSFAVDVQAASEAEIKVTGCVVDYGGRPYEEVNIALSGVNYKGGAGYTGNHSETRTDHRGEFTVRMKAGVPERPAQASIRGTREIFTTGGWTGSIRSEASVRGADVWPETLVENIGKPVDLRPKGCIRFPYPITVLGAVTSENLYEEDPWPHRSSLRLRLSRGDGHLDMGTPIPVDSRRVQEIDFGVDFRSGDTYSVDIIQQPYSLGPAVPPTQRMCIQCDLVRGATETIGQTPDIIIPVHRYRNLWGVQSLRLQCKRKSIVTPDASCEAGAAQGEAESAKTSDDGAPVALSREDAKSGAKQLGEVCNGQGTKKYPDRGHYTGNWVNCNRHGQGTYKAPNGDEYTGNWVDNKKQGQGTYTWSNGDQYTGNWVEGNRQGHGTYTWADGTRFTGEWQDDKKMNGTEIRPNGARVEIANGEVAKSSQQEAVAQAKLEEEKKAQERRDWAAQEARKREARADRQRQARKKQQEEQEAEDAQNAQEMSEAIGTLLGAFAQMEQNKADRAQAQQEQQRKAQEQQRIARVEEGKYYTPLSCASLSSKPSGNRTIPCMQNNCGRPIEVHGNGGMWSAGTGKCLSMNFTEFYAACEKDDGYDRSRNLCRR